MCLNWYYVLDLGELNNKLKNWLLVEITRIS